LHLRSPIYSSNLTVLDFLATRRDPSAFEYIPSSSAPTVLGRGRRQPPQSTAVLNLMAQANQAVDQDDNQDQDDDQNDQDDSEYVDIDDLIDPRLKLSTT
jgi:hypothetical protein